MAEESKLDLTNKNKIIKDTRLNDLDEKLTYVKEKTKLWTAKRLELKEYKEYLQGPEQDKTGF